MADGNRVVSDGLKAGREKYEAGDLAGARELFLKVLAVDENEPTARFHLDRIEDGDGASRPPPGPAEGGRGRRHAAGRRPRRRRASPRARRRSPAAYRFSVQPRVLAMVGIFAALVLGLVYFFVLRAPKSRLRRRRRRGPSGAPEPRVSRDRAAAPRRGKDHRSAHGAPPDPPEQPGPRRGPADAVGPRQVRRAGEPGAAPAAPEAGAAAAPASAVDADAAKLRVTAERALAEKRYIDALKNFSQAALAFRNDPTFAQSMGVAAEKVTALTPAVKLYNEGEYETAIPVLWRIFQEDRENQDAKRYLLRAYYNQGVTQLQNGLYPKAIESFDEALTLEPTDAEAARHKKFAERYLKGDLDLMGRIYVRHLNHRP